MPNLPQGHGGLAPRTLDPASETVAEGYYAATTLSAVDSDLAAANIKNGVTIFGFLGTYLSPVALDTSGEGFVSSAQTGVLGTLTSLYITIATGADLDIATVTPTFVDGSLAFASAFCLAASTNADTLKLRLYMGGVQVAESSYFGASITILFMNSATGFSALSGSQVVKMSVHNYSGSDENLNMYGYSGWVSGGVVSVGSIKATT